MKSQTIFLLQIFGLVFGQFDPYFIGNRSVLIQMHEWRFEDIANECENFLGPMGYGGVQLSPVTEVKVFDENAENLSWLIRYQPVSYLINGRSGDEEDLRDMIERCFKADVRVYVDVVFNHMAKGDGEIVGTAGSVANPSLFYYPSVPYGPGDFNKACVVDDNSDAHKIRNCQLVGLPDLNQGLEAVRENIKEFLNKLIDLGVAGLRIDATKNMWPQDLEAIYQSLNYLNTSFGYPERSKPFIYQGVVDLGGEATSK